MSKAFTKDDEGVDAPLVLQRRKPLPEGAPNYVTERGLALLQHELATARGTSRAGDAALEVARQARLTELEARLASAVLVPSAQQPQDEVRFGASVRVKNLGGHERRYRIVGVDEADAEHGTIAFVAPLARALLGKRIGDAAPITTPAGEDELTILTIGYDG